jgi:hypothetical protein
MGWLPYETWEVKTPVSIPILVMGLRRRIDIFSFSRLFKNPWTRDTSRFLGHAGMDGFELTRVIRYGNSFKPFLYGRFVAGPDGTTIRVTMTMHPAIWVFELFWFGPLLFFSLICFTLLVSQGEWVPLLFCLGMLSFGSLLTCGGFAAEAGPTKRLFAEAMAEIERDAAAIEALRPPQP